MPDKKNINRSFAAELRTLPVELVPPDPSGLQPVRKTRLGETLPEQPPAQAPRGLVDRLIDRIKRL
jgi:hypothetical protein